MVTLPEGSFRLAIRAADLFYVLYRGYWPETDEKNKLRLDGTGRGSL